MVESKSQHVLSVRAIFCKWIQYAKDQWLKANHNNPEIQTAVVESGFSTPKING